MDDVSFRCGVDQVRAIDPMGHQVFVADVAFLNGKKSLSTSVSFKCNASDLLQIRADGSLSFHGSSTTLESRERTVYRAPWHIVKMCVWVGGEYRFLGIFPTGFTSHIFQWPAQPGSRQWVERPIIGDRPAEEIEEEKLLGLIPGALACSDEVRFPYALVMDKRLAILVLPPLPLGGLGLIPLPRPSR